jgi:CubicO group peptidase (beta-lactamase class C family)
MPAAGRAVPPVDLGVSTSTFTRAASRRATGSSGLKSSLDVAHPGRSVNFCLPHKRRQFRKRKPLPGLPKGWGLTFMINEQTAPTGRSAGSLAWAGLFNTFFWIDPSKGMGGLFMTQVLPFVDPKTLQAFYDFETAAYQATSG